MTQTKKTKNPSDKSLNINIPEPDLLKPRITIFGVGGAGGNAINNMIRSNLEGVEFIAANTDAQALKNSLADNIIQLGLQTTKGLGAGSFPDRGRVAAEENLEEIEKYLEGSNMVFIAAGMGGGTGTGAAPVIAKLARERDILTVGVVTKPFHFEGKYRMETADAGIDELKKYVDTLIVIPNQNLFRIANEQTTFESAFKMADDVLHAGVRGVTDLITMPGLVNLDFADIRTIMTKMGKAMMGTGEAEGENRAIAACEAAISNPLLDDISIKGAKGVLVNMTGGPDMTLFEADMAVNAIKKEVDPNANIIFGSAFNENMEGKIRISVVATGIDIEDFKRDSLRIQDSQEPTRFKVSLSENENFKKRTDDESSLNVKNFFDPGLSATPSEEDVEEISDANFKPKKSYLKEENTNYGKSEDSSKTRENSDDGFTQVSFFGNEVEETMSNFKIEEDEAEEKPAKKSVEKKSKNSSKSEASNKKSKKDNSGFSLFSFMNKAKEGSQDNDAVENAENFEQHEEEVEPIEQELPKAPKKTADKKTTVAEKKRKEFFGSTIFDEEESKESNLVEDDILNVPAFFRRKQK